MTDLTVEKLWYVPLLQILILVTGTLLCYVIAYNLGDVSIYIPFISETGAYSPEKPIFSFCLIIGSFLGTLSVVVVFFQMTVAFEQGSFKSLNKACLALGLTSMIGLAGVAAFPMTSVYWAHLLFAATFFIGSAIYCTTITIFTYKIEGKSKKFYLRFILSIILTVLLFIISIFFPVSLDYWGKNNNIIPALKTPNDKGFGLLLVSSVIEWTIVIVILLFNVTLLMDMKDLSLKISEASNKNTETEPTPVEN